MIAAGRLLIYVEMYPRTFIPTSNSQSYVPLIDCLPRPFMLLQLNRSVQIDCNDLDTCHQYSVAIQPTRRPLINGSRPFGQSPTSNGIFSPPRPPSRKFASNSSLTPPLSHHGLSFLSRPTQLRIATSSPTTFTSAFCSSPAKYTTQRGCFPCKATPSSSPKPTAAPSSPLSNCYRNCSIGNVKR